MLLYPTANTSAKPQYKLKTYIYSIIEETLANYKDTTIETAFIHEVCNVMCFRVFYCCCSFFLLIS